MSSKCDSLYQQKSVWRINNPKKYDIEHFYLEARTDIFKKIYFMLKNHEWDLHIT